MEPFVKDVIPSNMSNMRIEIDAFIELYNAGKCELVDVRMPIKQK